MSDLIELAQSLIKIPSISPEDLGCQQIIAERLKKVGFEIQSMPFGKVSNLWARYGNKEPLLVFIGHTDVVPIGDLTHWKHHPFSGLVKDGYLHGRGAADMKGGLAAMIIAAEQFLQNHPEPKGSIAFLITSDEEDQAIDGTSKVVETLQKQNVPIHWCIVGEPSSEKSLADTLKIGRRGSLTAKLTVHGKQGHVAYPDVANNPIHRALSSLSELVNMAWGEETENFPRTSIQISNIHAGTGAANVIPDTLEVTFNLRYNSTLSKDIIVNKVNEILEKHQLNYEIQWHHNSQPFLSPMGELTTITQAACEKVTTIKPKLSTSGGTSDARFIAPLGTEIIELGPVNETIHQVNECVKIADLEQLVEIYQEILHKLFV